MKRSKSTKTIEFTVGSPFISILRFAIPVIGGNLFQLFYTLADSVIVGQTLGAESLAAVGATSIIVYFVLYKELPMDLEFVLDRNVERKMKKE